MDPKFEKRIDFSQIALHSPPHKNVSCDYSDRFIPVRKSHSLWHIHDAKVFVNSAVDSVNNQRDDRTTYSKLLKSELLGASFDNRQKYHAYATMMSASASCSSLCSESKNLFQYRVNTASAADSSPYSLSPVTQKSQRLLHSPRKQSRKVPRHPYKILDAPDLQDDFYLNLLDWSAQNMIAVGLESKVYIWNAASCEVFMCSDVSSVRDDIVTSVSFNEKGNLLAMGTDMGHVHLWDVQSNKNLSSISMHGERIGSLAWNKDMLASGSKDGSIAIMDTKTSSLQKKLLGHKQEVCGLKWSTASSNQLASGSNDNKVMIWAPLSSSHQPTAMYDKHTAAVKALAWSPHQHGLLATGGGTADRRIRFWNTLQAGKEELQCYDTGSQICAMAWSKLTNELVSTHGYAQNEVLLWKYPSMKQVARLTGHTTRVLYLALSPDGECIVTGAGDETLRFWSVFPKYKTDKIHESPLNMFSCVR
ncbi:hypothetical protein HELRODRAFT_108549 [Helobdella robusta]|uniref:CDC20/Fizzy WD40 domain-containing protein n=1 Tax=Helobdella robusta TaxID=6412 RepID=T1EEK3_HELRO|nr:hypothetical protein HELRODRAFT_108549 [Helobdella robusta]ESN90296.1 hypothetical protein HELRODRAFT_108549 [Helobdella robusta]